MEKRNQEAFVWPVVGRPASSSSLSSCVRCFKTFTSRPRRPLSFCLKIVVDKRLEILFDSASLLSFLYVYFIIFPQGFCGGRDDDCVVQEQGGTGVLCSVISFPAVFPVTFLLTVFVAAKCFPRG